MRSRVAHFVDINSGTFSRSNSCVIFCANFTPHFSLGKQLGAVRKWIHIFATRGLIEVPHSTGEGLNPKLFVEKMTIYSD